MKIGYYDQMHINLDDDKSVMETGWLLMPTEPQGKVIAYLARFGFYGDDLEKKVRVLSGGEKARLYLAKLIFSKPNLLLLDEPTNHLDLNTVANLENALINYDGTIVLVSHDLYFVKAIANKYWHFNNMEIKETVLSPEEIYNKEMEKSKGKKEKKVVEKKKIKKTNPIILDKKLEEISQKEDELKSAEKELENIQTEFSSPEIFSDSSKIKELNMKSNSIEKTISKLKEEIENLEIEYLELSS